MRPLVTAVVWLTLAGGLLAGEAPTENKFYVSAVELVKGGQHQAAKTLLDLALKDHPESPEVLLLSAECSAKLGKADEARGLYERALAAAGKLGGAQGATSAEKAKAGLKALGAAGPAADPKTPPGAPQIPADAQQFGGHSYKFYPAARGSVSWVEAKENCEKAGGYLACITGVAENDFVGGLAGGNRAWLGGTDEGSEGKWRWLSGEPFEYVRWGKGEPGNARGEEHFLMTWKGEWNDTITKDGNIAGYVCEWGTGKPVVATPAGGAKVVATDWETATWTGRKWLNQPRAKMTLASTADALNIKNSTGVHKIAHFRHRTVLRGDFECTVEARDAGGGQARATVCLVGAWGEDRALYVDATLAPDNWQKVRIIRKGTTVNFTLDDRPLETKSYRAAGDMAWVVAFSMPSDSAIEVRSFELKTGSSTVVTSPTPERPVTPGSPTSPAGTPKVVTADWETTTWTGRRYINQPNAQMTLSKTEDALSVRNTTGVHKLAHFRNKTSLRGDFECTVEARDAGGGQARATVCLVGAEDEDRALYVDATLAPGNWQKVRIIRKGTTVNFTLDDRALETKAHRATGDMACVVAFSMPSDSAIEVRSFELKAGSSSVAVGPVPKEPGTQGTPEVPGTPTSPASAPKVAAADWETTTWTGARWTNQKGQMTVSESEGALRAKNTTGIHNAAHFQYKAALTGDFTCTMEVRDASSGKDLSSVGLFSADGGDRNLHMDAALAPGKWQKVRITRSVRNVSCSLDDKPVGTKSYQASGNMACMIGFSVFSDGAIEIRSFELKTGSSAVAVGPTPKGPGTPETPTSPVTPATPGTPSTPTEDPKDPKTFLLGGAPLGQWELKRAEGGWNGNCAVSELKVTRNGEVVRIEYPDTAVGTLRLRHPTAAADLTIAVELRGDFRMHLSMTPGLGVEWIGGISPVTSPDAWQFVEVDKKGESLVWKLNGQEQRLDWWYSTRKKSAGRLCLLLEPGSCVEVRRMDFGEAAKRPGKFDVLKPPAGVPAEAMACGGHWYKVYEGKYSWFEAKRRADELGGYLACVNSPTEQRFLAGLSAGKPLWLGGTDEGSEGRWRWVSGEAFTYRDWADGQPDNAGNAEHYLQINVGKSPRWNDANVAEGSVVGFVCEWGAAVARAPEPVPVPTGAIGFSIRGVSAEATRSLGGHAYAFFAGPYAAQDAERICEQFDGHLVRIESAEENDFVRSMVKGAHIYIDGSDRKEEGKWVWSNGQPMTYTNWSGGEPNNGAAGGENFIEFKKDGLWNDAHGDPMNGFVCEWDKPPTLKSFSAGFADDYVWFEDGKSVDKVTLLAGGTARWASGPTGTWTLSDRELMLKRGAAETVFGTVVRPGIYETVAGGKVIRIVARASAVVTVEDGKRAAPASELIGVHELAAGNFQMARGLKGDTLILHQGRTLRILDADGVKVFKTLELPQAYDFVFEREGHWLALRKGAADLLDKTSLKATKTIELDVVRILDAVVHPRLPVAYAAAIDPDAKSGGAITARRLFKIDEDAGKSAMLPKILAQYLAIDPAGKYLFAGVSQMYQIGESYDINPYGPRLQIYTTPEYGYLDLLASFDIRNGTPEYVAANSRPGERGHCLAIAPDGSTIAYVAGRGYTSARHPGWQNIPAFDAENIEKAKVAYGVRGGPRAICFHPRLPLVAAGGGTFTFFRRDTGEALVPRLNLADEQLSGWGRMIFSPRGMHLLIECTDARGVRAIRSFPICLTAEEARALGRPLPVPDPAGPGPGTEPGAQVPAAELPRLADLDGLFGAGAAKMGNEEVARKFKQAVVVIKAGRASGTGFFVGSKGYVLTCAHVLPRSGKTEVVYTLKAGAGTVSMTAEAKILRTDERADLALLKIETAKDVPVASLEGASASAPAMGEAVSIIGHPGMGEQILEHTMTTGVVSNPKRDVEGLDHIQTSASVNKGCSGAPLFNSRGNVIGLVVLKAKLEGVAFAVPSEELERFLRTSARKE